MKEHEQKKTAKKEIAFAEDFLLTTEEVAKMTKRAKQTLNNDRSNNVGLPYVRYGRSVRYLYSDVMASYQQNRVVPANTQATQEN